MKWLQISDLHAINSTEWKLMQAAYFKKLKDEKIDFVVVTGDLHNYNDDYVNTKEFLKILVDKIKIDISKLYIVPGNHDAENFNTKDAIVEYIQQHIQDKPDCYLDMDSDLQKSFAKYNSFCKDLYKNAEYNVENVSIENFDGKLLIIKLNTALISNGKNEFEILDVQELIKLKNDNGLPVIVIGHHNVTDLHKSQQDIVRRIFSDLNVSAYLCGDSHKASREIFENINDNNKIIASVVCGKSAVDTSDSFSENQFIIYNKVGNKINVKLYEWDKVNKRFTKSTKLESDKGECEFTLYETEKKEIKSDADTEVEVSKESISENKLLIGLMLIGPRGANGIKYIWKCNGKLYQSLAFNSRICVEPTDSDKKISAYTSSISEGCILSSSNQQCVFCDSGKGKFKGYLTAEEIALQNIFMAEYDSDCTSYPKVRGNSREFAYMGQGEPGHAYHLIRRAIMLTDCAMEHIEQKVYRHVISTCGICDFVPLLINDINNSVFKNKVNLHFSLNAIDAERDYLMPINKEYPYPKFLESCKKLYEVTKEKIAVSIIIFNRIQVNGGNYTLDEEKLNEILLQLDPKIFRIDLRDYNSNESYQLEDVSNEYAMKLLKVVIDNGFDGKLFSCFEGGKTKSAFGLLSSSGLKCGMQAPGKTTINHYNKAIELLNLAITKVDYGENYE